MSSQYPPLPIYGTELNSPHSEYILPYSVPPQQSSLDTSSAQNNLPYDSAGSLTKGNIPATSVMHPQPQLNDAQTSGEKKRNKLGYHRTSLACGKFARLVLIINCPISKFIVKGTADGERLDAFHLLQILKEDVSTAFG